MTPNPLPTPKLILFDVYETLLDMSEIEKRVNALMNSKMGYRMWFEVFMQYCFVDNCTVQFNDFSSIAQATMQMTAGLFGKTISDHDIDDLLEVMKHLPLHEGVQEGLSKLKDLGFRLAALTNSPSRVVLDRMHRTGLISYFEMVLSAEHVQKYKPCIEVYDWAATKLGAAPETILLVSSHGWDIAGAANAKMKTACIKRGAELLYPLAPVPDISCYSVAELAEILAERSATDAG
ncbi:MAG: haloacid dehalogenase type II [Chitinophagaceae bacterium]